MLGPRAPSLLPLLPDFVPQRQKPFRLQGERLEAQKKVTQDGADHWFFERPPKGTNMEWLSVTFVVPKKRDGRVEGGG